MMMPHVVILFLATLISASAYSSPPSQHERTVVRKENTAGGAVLYLDDGQRFFVRFERASYNKTSLLLFYVGKRVWVGDRDKDGCFHLEPIKQTGMPTLTDEQYQALIRAGFTDADIEYSFKIPRGRSNPNRNQPTYGGLISYGAPGVCGEKR
jgi:hypothetical protein